jgi:hypothetical protein
MADMWSVFVAAFLLLEVGLFVGCLVTRRRARLPWLLGAGLVIGGGGILWEEKGAWDLSDALHVLLATGVVWLWLAVPGTVATLIQPGEPAPLLPGRGLRHLGLALVGCCAYSVLQSELTGFGLPVALVALGSLRAGPRVEAAWREGLALLGCAAAVWAGTAMAQVSFELPVFQVLLAFWIAVQGLAAALELRWRPGVGALGVGLGLLLLGLLVNWPLHRAERRVYRLSAGLTLPRCEDTWLSWLEPDLPVGTVAQPPPARAADAYPPSLVVADVEEDLGPLLRAPLSVACLDAGRYRYEAITEGGGVEVRLVGDRAVLASGEELSAQSLVAAAQSCGLSNPAIAPLAGERWPAQRLLDVCELRHCVVGGGVCTFRPGIGWHMR